MKNFLSNLCSSSRTDRVRTLAIDAVSLPSFCRVNMLKLVSVLVLILTVGVGNAWGADETLSFSGSDWSTGGYDNGSSNKNTSASHSISYAWTQTYKNSGIQMAKNSGEIHSTSYPSTNNVIKSVTVTVTTNSANIYGSTDGSSWSSITSGATVTASGYKYFKVTSTSKYCVLSSISVVYTAGSTPSLTPTPTSLNFGTVAQNASIAAKTFSVSGSNLTGAITIAAPSGYTVSPTSITPVSKSISATDVTVTPNTATAGTFNGNVTISGGGLASDVTVGLTMTVQASHTVTWMVNGSEHATTQVVSGGHPVFPSVPSSCDAGKVFVGWTETNIGSSETDTPPTFITTATTISSDKTYYAVFAKKGDFIRVTGPSSLANGQLLVIVSNKYSTAITNGIGYTTAPTESSSKVTATDAMTWLLTGNSSSGWTISKIANGYLLGYASNPSPNSSTAATLESNNSCSTWGIGQNSSTSNVLYISNKSTATCALEASSSSANWVVYNSSSYSTNQYCALKVYASTLTKFVTSCCTPLGSINGSFSRTIFHRIYAFL